MSDKVHDNEKHLIMVTSGAKRTPLAGGGSRDDSEAFAHLEGLVLLERGVPGSACNKSVPRSRVEDTRCPPRKGPERKWRSVRLPSIGALIRSLLASSPRPLLGRQCWERHFGKSLYKVATAVRST